MEDQMTFFFEVYGTLPRAGPGDDSSTRKAYRMMTGLPEKPKILDIGCGPGKQTLELARLSRGKIIALDNHQPFLDKVDQEAKALGLGQHIETLNQDMNAMDFGPESFDVIWAEGALYLMGFENGLKVCRPMLRRDGYIGVTELVWLEDNPSPEAREWAREYAAMKSVPDNLRLFKNNGYEMVGHFTLPVSSWFDDYYDPMQERIHELRKKYLDHRAALQVIESAQLEINGFKKCSGELGYEFFVARASASR
jgi:cyclopropane fatty-acyl-phospholipid synthase-like methyltransferase